MIIVQDSKKVNIVSNRCKYEEKCFWYRPWKDMSATFHQCHLKDIAKECDGMCEMFIHNNVVDKLIYKICNTPKYNSVLAEWIDVGDFEQCSNCKGTHLKEFESYYGKTKWVKTPYCPYCGAVMNNIN